MRRQYVLVVGLLALTGCGSAGPAATPDLRPAATAVAPTSSPIIRNTHHLADMDMHTDMNMPMNTHMPTATAAPHPTTHGFRLNLPLPRPDFVLTDTRGRRYDFAARTRGRATLLYFGYTNCPYQCPTAMADIAVALRKLP